MVGRSAVDLFRIKGVTKIYGKKFIFKNIHFTIRSGEIIGIVGKSGSGKTTLLNMLVGLTKPEEGQITYRNLHLINKDDDKAYRPVLTDNKEFKQMYSFASQKPSFYPNLTAIENLRYFGSLYGIPKQSLEHNANSLLELVDLSSSKDLIAARMSGGMQRRLDIACSLVHDPTVLILDEPTSDLDLVLSSKIWDILKTINEKGTTIVIVSHNIAELEHLCDRLVIFKEGRIATIGTPSEIKEKHLVEESIYLHSDPGKYAKVMKSLPKSTGKKVINWEIKGNTLVIDAVNTGDVVRDLVKALDTKKEKIIEIELRKPSLDKIFVQLENKVGKRISSKTKNEVKTKSSKKKSKTTKAVKKNTTTKKKTSLSQKKSQNKKKKSSPKNKEAPKLLEEPRVNKSPTVETPHIEQNIHNTETIGVENIIDKEGTEE